MNEWFDVPVNRKNSNSLKWDDMARYYPSGDLLPMWVADMDFRMAPAIEAALAAKVSHGVFGYAAAPAGFFEEPARWTARRYGHEMAPETLVYSPGVVPSLSMLVRQLTVENEPIIIQPPVYPPFAGCITQNGRRVLPNPLVETADGYRMDYDDLEQKASRQDVRWMILCNPHNPVGRVWSRDELKRVAEICLRNGVRVISDEIWRDLVLEPGRHVPFAGLGAEVEAITITCFSATKTFNLAGIQASYVSLPDPGDRRRFQDQLGRLDISRPNGFAIEAFAAAFCHGEPWLEALKRYLAENARTAAAFIAERLPEVKLHLPEATYLLWLDFRALEITDEALGELMTGTGRLALNAGHTFGAEGSGFMRMNIACPSAQVQEALERMETAVEAWRKG